MEQSGKVQKRLGRLQQTVQHHLTLGESFHSDHIKRQQAQALELTKRKFFIPAARLLMSALYDAKYLKSSSPSAACDELIKALERHRDVFVQFRPGVPDVF